MVGSSRGAAWIYDGDRIAGGSEGTWTLVGASATVDEGDYLKLTRAGTDASFTSASGGSAPPVGLNPTVFARIRIRYKCNNSSVKAGALVTFASGTQTVLAASNSLTLTVVDVLLDSAKGTISTVALYATTAAGTVYYDYVVIYKEFVTFPNTTEALLFYPKPRFSPIPLTTGITATQHNGSDGAEVHVTCDFTLGTWKSGADTVNGQAFLENIHNQSDGEPWQWIDTGQHQFKAYMSEPIFTYSADTEHRVETASFVWHEYRLSSPWNPHETYLTRWGLDL